MIGNVRPRGRGWQITYDVGKQPCQRCRDCGWRRWLSEGRVERCAACGGRLDTRTERRQQAQGGFRTKREAERALVEAVGALGNGAHVNATRLTLGEYLTEEWLPSRRPKDRSTAKAHRGQVSLTTWTGYRDIMSAYVVPRLGDVPLQQLGPEHLDRLYDELEAAGGRSGKALSPKPSLTRIAPCTRR